MFAQHLVYAKAPKLHIIGYVRGESTGDKCEWSQQYIRVIMTLPRSNAPNVTSKFIWDFCYCFFFCVILCVCCCCCCLSGCFVFAFAFAFVFIFFMLLLMLLLSNIALGLTEHSYQRLFHPSLCLFEGNFSPKVQEIRNDSIKLYCKSSACYLNSNYAAVLYVKQWRITLHYRRIDAAGY